MKRETEKEPDNGDGNAAAVAGELGVREAQARAVLRLLAEGATIPFIARYRKEATGGLDEVAIADIRDRDAKLRELADRREAILSSLTERGLLTPELEAVVASARTLAELEDVYLPYRPKRRTRALVARERGLAPLANVLLSGVDGREAIAEAGKFVDTEKGVPDADAALAGARDIVAEIVSESAESRAALRELFRDKGTVSARVVEGKETEGAKFRDWFDWSEPAGKAPSHRVLALFRGEAEGFLRLDLRPPEATAVQMLRGMWLKGRDSEQLRLAVDDSYDRLLAPSLENEARAALKERADGEAIRIFGDNLKELLLAAPLGGKRLLALDPGFRTGCKTVVLDAQGKLLHDTVVFPTGGKGQAETAKTTLLELCRRFQVEAVAIGNGTASRETEAFVRSLGLPASVAVVVVNEAGASVYSASEAAREEFPDKDATVRGAVSIGRRLMDPLAELVKIDPKSIGVGQYQHDVEQSALKLALDDVVAHCVNAVGVEVNTASPHLLSRVSGLNKALAKNIVKYRDENGPFASRSALKKVPRLGPKAFEQAAGFLRIRGGANPLDASAVHPERYDLVKRMAADLGLGVTDLLADAKARSAVEPKRYVDGDVGLPTIMDIMAELAKPGRDPRAEFAAFSFAEGVREFADVSVGMRLPGIVTNVAAFGAFIDIGVHQDGLAHISELADRYVRDPAEVVKVGQRVVATVIKVDAERRRISLSLKKGAVPAKGSAI